MSFLSSLTIAAAAADLAVNIKNAAEKLLTNKPKEKIMPDQKTSNTGWICPVCGKGLAPFVLVCSCVDKAAIYKNTKYGIENADEITGNHSTGQSKNSIDAAP